MGLANLFKTTKKGGSYRRILFACIVLCGAGICYAVWVSHAPMDATRGAVLALGLTLAFVVGKSDSAAEVYDALQKIAQVTQPPAQGNLTVEVDRLKQKFTDLEERLKSASEDEKQVNWYLVAATIIATIVSACGDIVSVWIMHCIGVTPVK